MTKRIPFPYGPKAKGSLTPPNQPDGRLVALVRFLARQAAERDYTELLETQGDDDGKTQH